MNYDFILAQKKSPDNSSGGFHQVAFATPHFFHLTMIAISNKIQVFTLTELSANSQIFNLYPHGENVAFD